MVNVNSDVLFLLSYRLGFNDDKIQLGSTKCYDDRPRCAVYSRLNHKLSSDMFSQA